MAFQPPPRGALVREPEAGDEYEFTSEVMTLDGTTFPVKDRLTLIEHTDRAPFGSYDPNGNWLVDARNGKTIWSNIRLLIQQGVLKLSHIDRRTRFNREDIL